MVGVCTVVLLPRPVEDACSGGDVKGKLRAVLLLYKHLALRLYARTSPAVRVGGWLKILNQESNSSFRSERRPKRSSRDWEYTYMYLRYLRGECESCNIERLRVCMRGWILGLAVAYVVVQLTSGYICTPLEISLVYTVQRC